MIRNWRSFKNIASIAFALVMSISVSAFAATQTVAQNPADADNATITINNPAKGETYNVYKLFDATVGANGEISYQCTGDIPSDLSAFFTKDTNNNVIPDDSILIKDDNGKVTGSKMTDELKAALETWAGKQSAATATAVSDGKEALSFTGLPYGYYVMTTTHKPDGENAKAAITVDSTKPNASIYDKNVNEPTAKKEVEEESYSIGDTVKYTATFDTTNYMGEGENAKQVVEYVITDTLPNYLDPATTKITKITIGGTEYKVEGNVPQFTNKSITIPWATKDESVTPAKFTSIYNQGAQIKIEYEAKLTSTTNINKADKNTVSIKPNVDNGNGDKEPWNKEWKDSAEITTYAAALKKVDGSSQPLTGAEFTVKGLVVEETESGVYTVVSYDPASTTESAAMKTDSNGKLYIVGLASDVSLTVTESKAPEGYNKLVGTETLKPQVLSKQLYKTSGYEKYDADGNLVEHKEATENEFVQVTKNLSELDAKALQIVNQSGTELPSTGGIGTTIFYVVGSILVVAAGVLLVTKKRMSREG